ncbi:MAG: tRNA adenosine(34) deaminase TadA [Thermoanaerobaculia bacterium]|nr:tRNA adenosine(34) deaminase TadA [Thermoanaerobaculia bacterium]
MGCKARDGAETTGEPGPDDREHDDRRWMREALAEALRAERLGEVPVGAVVVQDRQIIARGFNRREIDGDPLAHAEIIAIRQAAKIVGDWRLTGCTIYVTLEPCAMCAGALVNSRLDALVYATADPKTGFCGSLGSLVQEPRLNHQVEVRSGVLEVECAQLLRGFFRRLRRTPEGL